MTFGIAMAGCGRSFEKWLRYSIGRGSPFVYLEIGFGCGGTLAAVASILEQQARLTYRVIGIDMENGWSVDRDLLNQNVKDKQIELIWKPSEQAFENWMLPLHFCFVDGCHEKDCCKRDFELVEHFIMPGGIVAFHDSAEREQGTDLQPHLNQPVGVRDALRELGLLDGSKPGWEVLEDCQPQTDRGCFFVEKL